MSSYNDFVTKRNTQVAKLPPETQVRRDDPDTSHEAAQQIKDPTKVQARVIFIFREANHSLTDLSVLHRYATLFDEKVKESSPRKRRCDLVRLGLVENTGSTAMEDGRNRILWNLTALGQLTNIKDIFGLFPNGNKATDGLDSE